MSTDTANLSAFAAYNITPPKSSKQNKNKAGGKGKGKGKGNDTFIDEFLNDERKKFKSTNGKRSRSPNKLKQNLTNESRTEQKGANGTKKEVNLTVVSFC